jgi:hypothetical protein
MATYVPAKVSTQFIFFASLVSQANTKLFQVNPTIAAGDFKVSIDGAAQANLATLPVVTPAGSVMVKFTLSTSEMAGANATVVCSDAAGAEWCDLTINVPTAARQIDDLAYPATSGRSLTVSATGDVAADVVKLNSVTASAANLEKSASVQFRGSVTGAATVNSLIDSALTQATADFWVNRVIAFTSGTLLYQIAIITAFDPATDKITFSTVTVAPSAADTYVVL